MKSISLDSISQVRTFERALSSPMSSTSLTIYNLISLSLLGPIVSFTHLILIFPNTSLTHTTYTFTPSE